MQARYSCKRTIALLIGIQMSRLDLQITMYTVDPRPTQIHKELHTEGTNTLYNMPPTFFDLGEARSYLDLVQGRIWHFSKTPSPFQALSSLSSLNKEGLFYFSARSRHFHPREGEKLISSSPNARKRTIPKLRNGESRFPKIQEHS